MVLFMVVVTTAFGQSDTTDLNSYINTNFPDNTSGFITPERLRNVAKELMRSSANLQEINVFSEPLYVQDTVKSTVGFFAWDGSEWTEVGDLSDTAVWSRSGGFILPLEYGDKLSVDTARFGGLIYPATNGDINIGTSTLKFDTVFADVFDGISAPWAANGDSVYLGLSARVGIGTSSPQYPLRVSGIGYIDTTVTDFFQFLDGGSGSNGDVLTRSTAGVAHWEAPVDSSLFIRDVGAIFPKVLTDTLVIGTVYTPNESLKLMADTVVIGNDSTYFKKGVIPFMVGPFSAYAQGLFMDKSREGIQYGFSVADLYVNQGGGYVPFKINNTSFGAVDYANDWGALFIVEESGRLKMSYGGLNEPMTLMYMDTIISAKFTDTTASGSAGFSLTDNLYGTRNYDPFRVELGNANIYTRVKTQNFHVADTSSADDRWLQIDFTNEVAKIGFSGALLTLNPTDSTGSIGASSHPFITFDQTVSNNGVVIQEPLNVDSAAYFNGGIGIIDGNEAAGAVLVSDASGNASWQDPYAYGEMGFADSSYTLALTQNTPAWVTNASNDIWSVASVTMKDVTYSNDSLIVGMDGTYFFSGHLSVEGTTGSAIKAYTYKNGSVLCACVAEETLENNDIITLTIACDIAPLVEGDVITVWIENTASNDDVDLVSGKLTIHKIAP